jgi:hypothetical protein
MRLVLPISMSLLAAACTADKGAEGMIILNNTAPPVGATCTFTGDPLQPFVSSGTIAYEVIGSSVGYLMAPLVESRITADTTDLSNIPERTIHLEGANITAQVANGGTKQNYSVLFAGSVLPNQGTTNVVFEALPVSSIQAFSNGSQNVEVVLSIAMYGSLGGGRIDAEPFQFPVTILKSSTHLMCDSTALQIPTASPNPCNPYQDSDVVCCTDVTSGALLCPAVAQMGM